MQCPQCKKIEEDRGKEKQKLRKQSKSAKRTSPRIIKEVETILAMLRRPINLKYHLLSKKIKVPSTIPSTSCQTNNTLSPIVYSRVNQEKQGKLSFRHLTRVNNCLVKNNQRLQCSLFQPSSMLVKPKEHIDRIINQTKG